ncbi:BamA/OMP85 family outer membrane protein [Blattabacterium cuenoti]|uniref:BamA/OMP85 family outer membrane protein n=1 Tax=Blattabacterium cuenoti TaxID=1653831 RepID=UPI00163C0A27|nr:POTRA domain-containing protein [Blattabacterium cuenoti]
MFSFSETDFFLEKKQKESENIKNFFIKKIFIIGKTKYNQNIISKLSNIFPGDEIQLPGNTIDKAIKKLWKSNLFKKISIYKKNIYSSYHKNEINLFFDLDDFIEFDKVNIKGIDKNLFSILEKFFLKKHIYEYEINNIKNYIKNFYLKKGYPNILIDSKIINYNKKNILDIDVNKGEKIKIEKIIFSGNKIFTQKQLINFLIKTKTKFPISILKKYTSFIYENIEEDLKNIKSQYHSKGFIDVKIFLDSIKKNYNKNYIIKIKIIEGKKYYLGNINFIGNNIIHTNLLKKIISYQAGEIYNKQQINKNVFDQISNSILSYYLDLGYLFVKINLIEKKIENNKIFIDIKIEENKPVIINKINIIGNTITKDHIIRRELNLIPGDTFSSSKMRSSLLNLSKLNLFDNKKIYPFIKEDKEKENVNIEWHIVEKNSNQIQLHGGYENKKLIGTFQLNCGNFSFRNLFNIYSWTPIPQGEGQKLLLSSKFGKDFLLYNISFTNPWIEKNTPTLLSFNINFFKKKIKNIEDFSLLPTNDKIIIHEGFLKKIGTSIDFNKSLNYLDPKLKIIFSINYDKFFYNKNLFSNLNKKIQINNLNYLISLQRFTLKPDFIFPFQGSQIQVNSIFTLPYSFFLKKDKIKSYEDSFNWMEFFKFKITSFWYKKIMNKMVIKAGGEFGILGKYNKKTQLFPYQKFYMGGLKNLFNSKLENIDYISLRGYSFNKNHPDYINPNNGGIIYNKSIVEIRYLIKTLLNQSKLWTIGFIEGGIINDFYKNFNPLNMNKSLGLGFRFFYLPIGVFGIDMAYPIINRKKNNQSKWKMHFIIGKD